MLLPTVTLAAAALVGGPPAETIAPPTAPAAARPAPPASVSAWATATAPARPPAAATVTSGLRTTVAPAATDDLAARLLGLEARLATADAPTGRPADFTVTVADGRRTFVLTRRGGGELSASVDGEPVPAERILERDDSFVILGDDGEELHRFPTSITALEPAVLGASARPFDVRIAELLGRGGNGLADGWTIASSALAEAPATMLGAHLEAPGDALAAQLGLDVTEATVVTGVLEGLPGEAGGLRPFDVIVAIDGTAPAPPEVIRAALADAEPGDRMELTVVRRGDRRDVAVTLEAWDADRMQGAELRGRVARGLDARVAPLFAGRRGIDEGGRIGPKPAPRADGVFIAPGEDARRSDVTIFRQPGDWAVELPGGLGRVEIDRESAEELRKLAEELVAELEVELREELPRIVAELRGEAAEMEPMIREQLRELAPMLREQLVGLRPMVREQMREIGPVIAEIVALGRELEGLDPEEISAIVAERLEAAMRAVEEIEVQRRGVAREREAAILEQQEIVERRIAEARERARMAREQAGDAAEDAERRADRLERLEDRMSRIESMLERLVDRLERQDPPVRN